VGQASATEVKEVQYWTREEVGQLLETARLHEVRFAPLLVVLFSTGMRRGEALGLQWSDVDFDRGLISIRRSITSAGLSTPKSGSGRSVGMTAGLAEELFDLLASRRREQLSRGWSETTGAEAGDSSSQTPLCKAYVGHIRASRWSQHSLGCRSVGSR
jgi:integrase